jgi:hypothetical protein
VLPTDKSPAFLALLALNVHLAQRRRSQQAPSGFGHLIAPLLLETGSLCAPILIALTAVELSSGSVSVVVLALLTNIVSTGD